jgi:hypothetical protein
VMVSVEDVITTDPQLLLILMSVIIVSDVQ